jgi:hypothetical protein
MSKLLQHSLTSTTRFCTRKPILNTHLELLTQRLSLLQLSTLHTAPSTEKLSQREKQRNAFELEQKFGIRSRCLWTKEEDDLLLKLYKENGPRWSFFSRQFVNRPPAHCCNRINLITKRAENGPWSKKELKTLQEACEHLPPDSDDIDWAKVQKVLPERPLAVLKRKYKSACDPTLNKGRWSEQESNQLRTLVEKYGQNDFERISEIMGTRSRRQCMERWRWQMADMKKGRYTKEEDDAIVKAVEKYGENFAVVAKVIGSARTPRHISQHYRNLLAPNVDRSPWTREEEWKVYNAFLENEGNVIETKEAIQSKRSFRDIWNHIVKMRKIANREDLKRESAEKMIKEKQLDKVDV